MELIVSVFGWLVGPYDPPITNPLLLWLQTCIAAAAFIWNQVSMLAQQAVCPLNHVPRPKTFLKKKNKQTQTTSQMESILA